MPDSGFSSAQTLESNPQRSSQYYLETVVFQIENDLFRVPRWYFTTHSPIFRDMFSVPPPSEREVEGSSEDHPLILEGVIAEDFEALLSLMYPVPTYSAADGTRKFTQIPEEVDDKIKYYTSIIQLSRKWSFRGIHAFAIKQLSQWLCAADKLMLGQRLDVPAWIRDGCRDLVNREAQLTEPEAKRLGWKTTLGIFRLREMAFRTCAYGQRRPITLLSIQEVFGEQLILADNAYTEFYAETNH